MTSPFLHCGPCDETFSLAANAYQARWAAGWLIGAIAPCCGRQLAAYVPIGTWLAVKRLLSEFEAAEVVQFRRELNAAGPRAAALIGGST